MVHSSAWVMGAGKCFGVGQEGFTGEGGDGQEEAGKMGKRRGQREEESGHGLGGRYARLDSEYISPPFCLIMFPRPKSTFCNVT